MRDHQTTAARVLRAHQFLGSAPETERGQSPRQQRRPPLLRPAGRPRKETRRSRLSLGLLVAVLSLLVAGAVSAVAIDSEDPTDPLREASAVPEPKRPPAPPLDASPAPEPGATAAPPSTGGPTPSTPPATGDSPTPEPPATGGSTVTTRAVPGTKATSLAPTTTRRATASTTQATTRPVTTTLVVPAAGNTVSDALNALNGDRLSQGLPALRVRSDLQGKAQSWAEKLARENAYYHSNLRDGLAPCWTGLAENIGTGASVADAEQTLMGDPPHRANILGRWNWVGVGVARTGRGVIVVQVYMSGCL